MQWDLQGVPLPFFSGTPDTRFVFDATLHDYNNAQDVVVPRDAEFFSPLSLLMPPIPDAEVERILQNSGMQDPQMLDSSLTR